MKMDVEIISNETIKPSLPTPDNLRHYKLCSLDQIINPGTYTAIVFFYPNHDTTTNTQLLVDQRIDLLKKSLSEVLTRFFPLSGTVRDELSVDCDDHGASFTTAKVNSDCRLSEFLQESPDLKLITQLFLPSGGNVVISDDKSIYLTYIQATVFEKCGGIALGACISHTFLDGPGLGFFLKSWADIAAAAASVSKLHEVLSSNSNNNNNNIFYPDFSAASSLFPAHDLRVREASSALLGSIKKAQFVTKRFVFNGSAVATLKDKAIIGTSGNDQQPPTRVEAISAFIWKCTIDVARGTNKPTVLTHAVNLRNRAAPYLSHRSLGNLLWTAIASISGEKRNRQQLGFPDLVNEIRNSISKIDGEFVKKLTGDGGSSTILEHLKGYFGEVCSKGDVDYFCFSSWCNFGFYEIDFGWGKPAWVSSRDAGGTIGMNLIVLIDTKCGKGVEAWMTLDEQQMVALESNREFRAFASFNPSPLQTGIIAN